MNGNSAVFLDRDGVLNKARVVDGLPYPPSSIVELELLPGVREACSALHNSGFLLIVATNQPDIARGTVSLSSVQQINDALCAELPLDDVVICGHDTKDNCACRKPRPGMLVESAQRLSINLQRSVMVGDRWKDIEAGQAAGCATVYIDRNYREAKPTNPDLVVAELGDAVSWICEQEYVKEEPCQV